MTTLLEQTQALRDDSELDAAEQVTQAKVYFRDLLLRADCPRDGDADSLRLVLDDLGISEIGFNNHLSILKQFDRLRARHARVADARAESIRARDAFAATKKRHQAEIAKANCANNTAASDFSACHGALGEAHKLAKSAPLLFAPPEHGKFPAFVGEK